MKSQSDVCTQNGEDSKDGALKPRRRRAAACDANVATVSWEAMLEARKRPRLDENLPVTDWFQSSGSTSSASVWGSQNDSGGQPTNTHVFGGSCSAWGDLPSETVSTTVACAKLSTKELLRHSTAFSVELRLPCGDVVQTGDGARLLARAYKFFSGPLYTRHVETFLLRHVNGSQMLAASGQVLRLPVDTGDGSACPSAAGLRIAVKVAVSEANMLSDASIFRTNDSCGPLARGARDVTETRCVEDTLLALEVLQAASLLGLSELEQKAERWLLDDSNAALSDATALPLFANSFGRNKRVSTACIAHLSDRGVEVLRGRERQLGVLYATHPKAAAVFSGLYRAATLDARRASSNAALPPDSAACLRGLFALR